MGNPVPGLPSPVSLYKKKTTPIGMVFLKLVKRYELPELIRYAKSTARVFPGYVQVRAKDPAGPAFNAALHGDLHSSSVLGPVSAHRAECDARLVLAGLADRGVDNSQVKFVFVGEILQRH
jgi:hypothetical protein